MKNYAEGTVARITHGTTGKTYTAIRGKGAAQDAGWYSAEMGFTSDRVVRDIRPLVVLDLSTMPCAPQSAVDRLRAASKLGTRHTFGWLADQIEAQTKPARIPEPKLGAHVEARKPDGTTAEFVRVGSRHWSEIGNGSGWEWSDLADPVLVRTLGE